MTCRLSLNQTFGWTVFLLLLGSPAAAHNIQRAGNIAGVWHVEPNHNPKAGKPSTAWIALTRKGGQTLSIEQAKCQMAVYSQPRKAGSLPVLQPTVKAVSNQEYQSIPSTDIVFPTAGLYQLELSCAPKTQGNFQPFLLKYDVAVAPGPTASTPRATASDAPKKLAQSQQTPISSTDNQQLNQSNQSLSTWIISASAIFSILGLGILVQRQSMKR